MPKRMGTSRSQLDRLLDPDNPNVLLDTVQKAATAVGKRLTIGLTGNCRLFDCRSTFRRARRFARGLNAPVATSRDLGATSRPPDSPSCSW